MCVLMGNDMVLCLFCVIAEGCVLAWIICLPTCTCGYLCWVCCVDFLYLVRLLCEVRMASLCASTGCSTTCLPCVIGCICGAHLLGIVHSCCVLGVVVGSGLYIYCVPCYVLLAV